MLQLWEPLTHVQCSFMGCLSHKPCLPRLVHRALYQTDSKVNCGFAFLRLFMFIKTAAVVQLESLNTLYGRETASSRPLILGSHITASFIRHFLLKSKAVERNKQIIQPGQVKISLVFSSVNKILHKHLLRIPTYCSFQPINQIRAEEDDPKIK